MLYSEVRTYLSCMSADVDLAKPYPSTTLSGTATYGSIAMAPATVDDDVSKVPHVSIISLNIKLLLKVRLKAKKPFFAYICTNAPHGPFHCPQKYLDMYKDQSEKIASFFGMITNVDDNAFDCEYVLIPRQRVFPCVQL